MGSKTTEIKAREMLYPEQIYQEFEGETPPGGTSIRRVEWLLGFLLAKPQ